MMLAFVIASIPSASWGKEPLADTSDHFETRLSPDIVVHTFTRQTGEPHASHLLVCGGQSWLVDCHSGRLANEIAALNLPLPSRIFHTHIQPEHTRENQGCLAGDECQPVGSTARPFADADVCVHESLVTLASDRKAYDQLIRTTWDDPMDWPHSAGKETFGVAGSVTMLPPEQPLVVTSTFTAHDVIVLDEAKQLTFKVIALPGHGGEFACGFLLQVDEQPMALFCGDLLTVDRTRLLPVLVNVYDLEYAYGRTRLDQMPAMLNAAADLGTLLFFPATGPVMHDGPSLARRLATNIDTYHQACLWRSGDFKRETKARPELLGRWFKHAEGIYQLNQFGNTIVLIDEQGRGLLVDPGPCDFGDDERTRRFEKDLNKLHEQAGLKTIELVLITHFHGDHIDMTALVRERYPQVRIAAWGPVADVIGEPQKYPYPCMLPWYNLGGETSVSCDDRLRLDTVYQWHDVAIRTLHTPGHCYVHAAYLLTLGEMHLAITGDTIQSNGDADTIEFPIANDSVPDAERGQLKGLYALVGERVDLNLGGHGSHFSNPGPVYAESIRRVEHAQAALKMIVADGDLQKAFRRPWFVEIELI